jgi:hypothetical protein
MKNRIKILAAAGLVLSVAIIIAGCSTEEPWSPTGGGGLNLSLVSGPSDSVTVPLGNTISFSWTSTGGSGAIQYRSRLDSGDWSGWSRNTFVTLHGLAEGLHTFSIQAQDAANNSREISSIFRVVAMGEDDTDLPSVTVTQSPVEGSFVATGSSVSFSWEGTDPTAGDNLLYRYTFAGATSEWIPARTVTFTNLAADTAAQFVLEAMDPSGNISESAMVSFIVKDATILYVDDYQWVDPFQNVDMVKEREQKAFYRQVLEGYAFAEWDVALQRGMPDSAYIVGFTTVVFASDSRLGDASSTWWFEVGDAGGGVLRYYMENGGHLLAAGANILQWIYNSNPPAAGDFEFDWFGIDSTAGWDFWADFTWAVSAGNFEELPDSMKIDVGKNGDQIDYAEDIFGFRDSAAVMYVKGLDIAGGEPADYGVSVGHIFYPDGGSAKTAMLNFDAFSMPLPEIRRTFQLILNEFGE